MKQVIHPIHRLRLNNGSEEIAKDPREKDRNPSRKRPTTLTRQPAPSLSGACGGSSCCGEKKGGFLGRWQSEARRPDAESGASWNFRLVPFLSMWLHSHKCMQEALLPSSR